MDSVIAQLSATPAFGLHLSMGLRFPGLAEGHLIQD
jgi:hypothetical protein